MPEGLAEHQAVHHLDFKNLRVLTGLISSMNRQL